MRVTSVVESRPSPSVSTPTVTFVPPYSQLAPGGSSLVETSEFAPSPPDGPSGPSQPTNTIAKPTTKDVKRICFAFTQFSGQRFDGGLVPIRAALAPDVRRTELSARVSTAG